MRSGDLLKRLDTLLNFCFAAKRWAIISYFASDLSLIQPISNQTQGLELEHDTIAQWKPHLLSLIISCEDCLSGIHTHTVSDETFYLASYTNTHTNTHYTFPSGVWESPTCLPVLSQFRLMHPLGIMRPLIILIPVLALKKKNSLLIWRNFFWNEPISFPPDVHSPSVVLL